MKLVFIDIDNTLLDFDECVKQAMQSGLQKYGLKKYENYMPSNRYDIIRPAAEYIRKNYGESGITNDFLAELCGISTVYFRKVFTKYYGVPPAQYLNMQRMEKAQEFLQSDYSSITQIAESVGYNSIYHFSKMFKKQVGISPSEYAKSRIAKIK